MNKHLVSIIIVNFNGKHLLEECLGAVFKSSFPKNNFEVILVDNNSDDESVSFVKKKFPEVVLVENKTNQGFAGGSNTGFAVAKGEYLVLLNSDVRVDKNWLEELVSAVMPKSVGLACSKLYYATPFIEMKILSDVEIASNVQKGIDGFSPLGVLIEDIVCQTNDESSLIWYMSGFYKMIQGAVPTRWTNGRGKVLLPFSNSIEKYSITVHDAPKNVKNGTHLKILLGDAILTKTIMKPKKIQQIDIKVSKEQAKDKLIWLVQNTGNIVFKNGLSRDRGSVVKRDGSELKEFYDFDNKHYSQPEKLLAACGASCIIKRAVLDEVGVFDPAYFMYYEDIDLSLKAWRADWDIAFAPKSIGYHKHRTTTKKQGDEFLATLLEKNHLLLLLTHFQLHVFIKEFLLFFTKLVYSVIVSKLFYRISYYSKYQSTLAKKARYRIQAFKEFSKEFRRVFALRLSLQKKYTRSITEHLY